MSSLAASTKLYRNFRAFCSSHLQCPTHLALSTPCGVGEGRGDREGELESMGKGQNRVMGQ